jgi:hypothetical protein
VGGDLTLDQLAITESAGPSAVYVQGKALIRNCTFLECRASRNVMRVTTALGVSVVLDSFGGALRVQAGMVEIMDSTFFRNAVNAIGGGWAQGGALFSCCGSTLSITATDFVENLSCGSKDSGGAAISLQNTTLVLLRSKVARNRCQGGMSAYGAGLYSLDSVLEIGSTDLVYNLVHTDGRYANGGATLLEWTERSPAPQPAPV